jgi:hypothetical protein
MAITEKEKIVFLKRGKKTEEQFASLFKNAIETNKEENTKDHVDLNISVGIDVKGLKKINRSDEETNEHIHWIELFGITGLKGWLYGKAEFFAFELKNYWVVVAKEDLQKFIAEKCKNKIHVDKPELYKLYQRKGRKDLITLVTSYDLLYICTSQIKK